MTISDTTQILYYTPKASPPLIVSPQTDAHWSKSRIITFRWKYNGYDIQYGYVIQILKTSEKDLSDADKLEWESGEDILDLTNIYEYSETSIDNFVSLNLSTIISLDGVYRWRIKTKGFLAQEYTDWSNKIEGNEGYVRIDRKSPVIRNASIISKIGSGDESKKLAFTVSDMSSPYLRTRRDLGYDRHIEREAYPGLYVNYDYRDHSITLRTQTGNSLLENSKRRYYGLISFYSDEKTIVPTYTVQEAVKNGYVYKINKDETDGPYQNTFIRDIISANSNGIGGYDLDSLIYTEDQTLDEEGNPYFIPKGFPRFWNADIKSECTVKKHPATNHDSNKYSYFSVFPFHTRYVVGPRNYVINGVDCSFSNFIELIYPAPFLDVFVLFTSDFKRVLAYGRYASYDNAYAVFQIPSLSTRFTLLKGINVESALNSEEIKSQQNQQFFTQTDISYIFPYDFWSWSSNSSGLKFPNLPYSQYLFFNLVPDSDNNDMGMKLYLNQNLWNSYEKGNIENKVN